MATNFTVKEIKVEDFVSIDTEGSTITITLFRGQMQALTPGWANRMELSPDQAYAVGQELVRRAEMFHAHKS